MKDSNTTYSINQLVQFTGLTDRTIRSYISADILKGEKTGGAWHFTLEQVESFLRHPAVRPSILAKNNALVYDFLLDTHKGQQEVCMILDIPAADKNSIADFFCNHINNGACRDISFSFDGVEHVSRVILKGNLAEVLRLVNEYNKL